MGLFLAESPAEVTSQAEEAKQTDDVTQADMVQQVSRAAKAAIQMRSAHVRSHVPTTSTSTGSKWYTGG